MNATVNTKQLRQVLARLKKVGRKSNTGSSEALCHAYLRTEDGSLSCLATDLGTTIEATIPATMTEEGRGSARLWDLAKVLTRIDTDEVSISTGDSRLIVEGGLRAILLPQLDVYMDGSLELPSAEHDGEHSPVEAAGNIATWLDRVMYSISSDESRHRINWLCLEFDRTGIWTFVSTDRHRMAKAGFMPNSTLNIDNGKTQPCHNALHSRHILLNHEFVKALRMACVGNKGNMVSACLHNYRFFVTVGQYKISTVVSDISFAPWHTIVPSGYIDHMTVDRYGFMGIMTAVSEIRNGDENRRSKWVVNTNNVEVMSVGPDGETNHDGIQVNEVMQCSAVQSFQSRRWSLR
jgi:DNA polymerase III sliding clamp (beta) subunit (PCNA family)